MIHTINQFRKDNGRHLVVLWDNVVGQYCEQHSWAMVRAGYLYHAEPCFLNGWAECVAMCSHTSNWEELSRRLIYDCFGTSDRHKHIILDHDCMAYGLVIHNHQAYLTVRAR